MSRTAAIAALRDRIRQIEGPVRHGVLPFGVAAIDRALPEGGLPLGAVHEILGAGSDEEDGAAAAGFVVGILARLGLGPVLWCLKRPDLYGPGLLAHGFDPARLVLVTARRDNDLLWAAEEGLRVPRLSVPGLAAVVGEIGRLPMVAGRRLQLAAERSGVPLFLVRRWRNGEDAAAERNRPSAAVTRWRVTALPSVDMANEPSGGGVAKRLGLGLGRPRWRVELLRVRGGVPAVWELEVADATGHVSLSAVLADPPAAPVGQQTASDAVEPWRRAG